LTIELHPVLLRVCGSLDSLRPRG